MKNGDDIHYFKDISAFNESLYSNPSDPSLGYMNNTTGSDMFDLIRKFLKNTEYLCGSTIMIAAKRYPNEEDLISDLQKNHVFVYILSSDTPSGGSNPSAMFNLATRTNGFCVLSTEDSLDSLYINRKFLIFEPNQIAAHTFAVSGKGSQTIPFKTSLLNYDEYGGQLYIDLDIIYQDRKVDGSLKSMNVTVTDEFGNEFPYPGYLNTPYNEFFDLFMANNTPILSDC